ncbi:hypothetical protein [Nostoc sp.]|uniref:hypothetical protein n=1 Tax=Nostoc sp. TaxID=1180 RepID=UPI002FF07D7E
MTVILSLENKNWDAPVGSPLAFSQSSHSASMYGYKSGRGTAVPLLSQSGLDFMQLRTAIGNQPQNLEL